MRRNRKKVEKFCCKDHMIEYSKRKQIRKSKGATGLTWKTNMGEKITRSDGMISHFSGPKNFYHSKIVKSRKSKWVKSDAKFH